MGILIKKLKITRIKLFFANILYYLVKIFFWKDIQQVNRHGINFELDLNEGIDLHLFLFGNFQKHITENQCIDINENATIIDVGANTGVISLIFAQKAANGHVYAFEPTDYAIKKMHTNLDLNPQLRERITLTQCFVSDKEKDSSDLKAYSSWPIRSSKEKHNIHRGVDMTTPDVPSITLDGYCEKNGIAKVDLMKIDTDGHELGVLNGAGQMIMKYKPQIIFELGIYVMKERGISFTDYNAYFSAKNYDMFTPKGEKITMDNYEEYVPQFGTIDVIALPKK